MGSLADTTTEKVPKARKRRDPAQAPAGPAGPPSLSSAGGKRSRANASAAGHLSEDDLLKLPGDLQTCARELGFVPDCFWHLLPERIMQGEMLGRSENAVGCCETRLFGLISYLGVKKKIKYVASKL